MEWQLAEAKNRFSEVVNRALAEGPQFVYRRKDSVVVVARRDFERLMGRRPSFKKFLTGKGPSIDGLDLSRDRSSMRDAKL
jgi:antitoxin Phd